MYICISYVFFVCCICFVSVGALYVDNVKLHSIYGYLISSYIVWSPISCLLCTNMANKANPDCDSKHFLYFTVTDSFTKGLRLFHITWFIALN